MQQLRDLFSVSRRAQPKGGNGALRRLARGFIPYRLRAGFKRRAQRARFEIRLARHYLYDRSRFRRHSAIRSTLSRENLRALITMDYHRIEKGLALRDPRVGFGEWFLPRLLSNLQTYHAAYGPDRILLVALNALAAYVRFNEANDYQQPAVREGLNTLLRRVGDAPELCEGGEGGIRRLSGQEVKANACRDLDAFFRSRHSVRHFGDSPLPREIVEKAVSLAVYSPSVCNRESWRVHVFSDPESKSSVLRHQSGNRGFGDQAAHVLIVTTDIQCFASIGERNQSWIDGGMFAMSLIWALHSLGVGTCCLNFCVEKETDAALRACADIPDSQVVIMMVAVGPLPDEFAVAQSPRRALDEVIVFHDATPSNPQS